MRALIPLTLVLLAFSSCGFEEFENEPPIQLMGYIMVDSNQPAVVDTFRVTQFHRYNEEREYWSEEIVTDSVGFFFFEYPKNNKKHGGADCSKTGGLTFEYTSAGNLSSFWDSRSFATCLPSNVDFGPVLYLNKDARIELLFKGEIGDGDTLFFSIPPIDSLHPNYYRRVFEDETYNLVAIPGPFTDLSFVYHAVNPNSSYEGWSNGLRGEFDAFHAFSWIPFTVKHADQFSFATPIRLRGIPFQDRISIVNGEINFYP